MASNPTKLDDLEMLLLLALKLTIYMERVAAGEKDPFPYPDVLLRGFNQLILTCTLRDVPRAGRPVSIPADMLAVGDRLLDPDYDGRSTELCRKLSRGEVMLLTVKGVTICKLSLLRSLLSRQGERLYISQTERSSIRVLR